MKLKRLQLEIKLADEFSCFFIQMISGEIIMTERGINFVRPAVEEEYGIVSVFEDLYGNLWDFIQPK